MKKLLIAFQFISLISFAQSATKTMLRLPDTGETTKYTTTAGEDADYSINPPYFTINGDGTVTDTVTGLMWQQTDGGEMTIENARIYVDSLTLGGHTDWRLPSAFESFSILNEQHVNPAIDPAVFTVTTADYWWTADRQVNDTTKIWVTNAGGGVGNHPKAETISAGGTKHFNVRAVRDVNTPQTIAARFTDNGDGTITDHITDLVWQKMAYSDSVTWEQALAYADTLYLAGHTDWRLPNIKELQSLTNPKLINPSVSTSVFPSIHTNKYWSSTSLPNHTTWAWYLDTQFGITTYDAKTIRHYLMCVRGPQTVIGTGIADIRNTPTKAYPNPFSSFIHLSADNKMKAVELSNEMGQVIYCGTDIEHKDLSYLPGGIYFLRICGDEINIIKLVKE